MNRENYKTKRGNPKKNSASKKPIKQKMAKPRASTSTAAPKLRAIYNTRIEWATKIIPKLKE